MRLTDCQLSNSGLSSCFVKSAVPGIKPQPRMRGLTKAHLRSITLDCSNHYSVGCYPPRARKLLFKEAHLKDKLRLTLGIRQGSNGRTCARASSDEAGGGYAEEVTEETNEATQSQAGGSGRPSVGNVKEWVRTRWETVSGAVKDPSARENWKDHVRQARHETWRRILAVWQHPICKRIFLSLSLANITIRAAEVSALLSTLLPVRGLLAWASLPAMAPFVVGAGLVLRTVMRDASVVLPRLGTCCCILYLLWAVNAQLKRWLHAQHVLSSTISRAITIAAEMASAAISIFTVLTTFGVNMYSILLPAAVTLALASKDITHNFLAGFFLFSAEPFKPGDYVSVVAGAPLTHAGGGPVPRRAAAPTGEAPTNGAAARPGGADATLPSLPRSNGSAPWPATPSSPASAAPSWFRGVCESIDLRYTVLRDGKQHLYVPNSVFMKSMFLVEVEPEGGEAPREEDVAVAGSWPGMGAEEEVNGQAKGAQGEPLQAGRGGVAVATVAVGSADGSAQEPAQSDVNAAQ